MRNPYNLPLAIVSALVVLFIAATAIFGHDKAMEQCQKTHSYETCFQQLNR